MKARHAEELRKFDVEAIQGSINQHIILLVQMNALEDPSYRVLYFVAISLLLGLWAIAVAM